MISFRNVLQSQLVKSATFVAAFAFVSSVSADAKVGEPLQLAQLTDGFNAEQAYMQGCFACHNAGAGGAPKLEDAEGWNTRMEKGMEAMMNNVINGINAMPAKGLCFTCTNEDLQAIVQFMYDSSQKQ